jgi:uncharacterized protein YodC (DUF2158 family)
MSDLLNEGDLVRLGGGGPVMSVTEVLGDKVACLWFDALGHLQERSFSIKNLYRVADDDNTNRVSDHGVSGS